MATEERGILYNTVSFRFLRFCKFLPKHGQNPRHCLIKINVIFSIVFVLNFFIAAYIYTGLERHLELDVIKFSVVCLVSFAGLMWINIFCVKNRELLLTLAEKVVNFQTFKKPPQFEKFHKKMMFFSKLHLVYITCASASYFIFFAPIHGRSCDKINKTRNLTEVCTLLIALHIPFVENQNLGKFPIVYIINSIIFFIAFYMYVVGGTIVWLNVELVEYIRIRIRHVKILLLKAMRNTDQVERRRELRYALKYHVAVYQMGILADKFFGIELFLHVVLTGVNLGVSAFVMIQGGSLESLLIFVGWLNAIIMGCVAGQHLTNEGSAIFDVLYHVNWYDFDIGLKKDLVFFLLRSNRPMCIRAGNVVMTNRLLIQILRTAYSYITFLRNIAQN
ncbi:odorant receptor 30a-like [Euwallacea similis]|uniref:odorant receptor 30a-like n=1 Tax=Euwallacea similis TaxID=1736056 RepID=UPI00344B63B3